MKFSYFNIFIDTAYVKFSTCSLIYSRKASLLHRPIRLITITESPDRNIVIAPQDLIECKPISSLEKPSFSLPIKSTIALSLGNTCAESIYTAVPSSVVKLHTFDSLLDPVFNRTLLIILAPARIGQRSRSLVANI